MEARRSEQARWVRTCKGRLALRRCPQGHIRSRQSIRATQTSRGRTLTALTETINAPLDLSFGAAAGSSTSATVKAGQTAMYSLQLSLIGGSATDQLTVTVSCMGAPPKATC